jgi:hypothetical protein
MLSKREKETIIANVIFSALRHSNRGAFILGDVDNDIVLLDGNFNFRVIARLVRRDLERLRLLIEITEDKTGCVSVVI